jgi:pimeloyl-ACP methyl ester carboxylesterase
VSFPSADGGIVHADLYGTGARGLVLAHGGRFTKESWRKQAPAFVDAGFCVLAIDFRGRGQSKGGPQPNSENEPYHDVTAAVKYLRDNGAESVSAVGGSFGGWAAAKSAVAQPGTIERLVLLAASGVEDPDRLAGRKLFITARDDANDSGLRLPGIRAGYERAPQPKELVILDGSAHAQYLFDTDQADRLLREILRFLTAP